MQTLAGKVALVTGGARRLGRAIALALAEAGASVIIHHHQLLPAVTQTLADLHARGVAAHAIQGDLSKIDQAENVVDTALAQAGQIDILVNNAGIWGPTPIGQTSVERWDELMNTNLRAAYFVTQRAAPALRAARGAVVNIADVGVERPWREHAAYLATKGGIVALTRALATDLAPEVRVNTIAPGPVLMPDDWSAEQGASAARSTLLKRLGRPEDVGQAVQFLAMADYITGIVLPVDGGHLLA
jgi:pteridine reductase